LIFLLKRRSALSKVSPSRTLTSDTLEFTSFTPCSDGRDTLLI
jgi:hypothetical protein